MREDRREEGDIEIKKERRYNRFSHHLMYPFGPGSHSNRYLCKFVKCVFFSFVFALTASAVYDSAGRPP